MTRQAIAPLSTSIARVSAEVVAARRSRRSDIRISLNAGAAACISICGWFASTWMSFAVHA